MTKTVLFLVGAIYWLFLHRIVYLNIGEATLLSMLTAFVWYRIRKFREANWGPNFYNDNREVWTSWHILCFLSGGIVLSAIVFPS